MKHEHIYWVETEEDIDNFDDESASIEHGYDGWKLVVKSTGDTYLPVYNQKANGDFDGLMGWG